MKRGIFAFGLGIMLLSLAGQTLQAQGLAGGFVQVLVHAQRDVVGRRFGPWSAESHVGAQVKVEGAAQRGLDGRRADLAVALGGVTVAGRKKRAVVEHRQIERRAGDQLLEVQVAAVLV